jgi:hypothetical protein
VDGTLNADTTGGTVTIYFNGVINTGNACAINNLSKMPSSLLFFGEQNSNTHVLACPAPLHAYLEERSGTWSLYGPLYGRVWGGNVTVFGSGSVHANAGPNQSSPARVTWEKTTWAQRYKRQ